MRKFSFHFHAGCFKIIQYFYFALSISNLYNLSANTIQELLKLLPIILTD
jgi:hypothetical protein